MLEMAQDNSGWGCRQARTVEVLDIDHRADIYRRSLRRHERHPEARN
jgi:hypothetical protein